jgi:hypothetical protein
VSSKSVGAEGVEKGFKAPAPKRGTKKTASNDRGGRGVTPGTRRKPKGTPFTAKPKRAAVKQSVTGKGQDDIKLKRRRGDATAEAADDGSEIGRRVGRSRSNLKAVHARDGKSRGRETSQEHTARRNVKLKDTGMAKTLEDSATGKPSRKSTRRSANRTKESQLTRKVKRNLHSPESRAMRSRSVAG